MVDEGPRPGVVEEVAQLLADVAVVHVERGHPGPEGAQHPLEVLVAVVEGQARVVLAGLVAGQLVRAGADAQPSPVQVGGQARERSANWA